MRYLFALIGMVAVLGFAGITHAKDATTKPVKPRKGHVIKVEEMVLTYHGGAKGKGKEYSAKITDKTKITLDGKEAKATDLKGDMYVEVTTGEGDVATVIAASTKTPEAPAKTGDAGKTGDAPKTGDSKTPPPAAK